MRKEHWLLVSVIVVIALWYLTPYLVNWLVPVNTDAIAARGQFGDMYGFITSLFSGLTIIGLVYTIIQQQDDLRLAREANKQQRIDAQTNIEALNLARDEMALTKTAVEQSANELKNQIRQQKFQRFETTFFNLTDQFLKTSERFTIADINNEIQELFKANFEYIGTQSANQKQIIEDRIEARVRNSSKKYYSFISSFRSITGWICDRKKKKKKSRETYFALFFNFLSHEQRVLLLVFTAFAKTTPKSASEYLPQLMISITHKKIGGLIEIKVNQLIESLGVSNDTN